MASYVGNKPLFGNFDKLDDISSSFNGSANTFAMTSNSRGVTAGDETQVVISLNGVIQEPVTDYFLATTGQIQFTTAPASGTAFFGYVTGNIGGTASTITDGIVTTAKLANTAGTGSAVQLAANTTALTVAANGNIGIGTTSPTSFANYTTVAINGTTGSIIDLEHGGTINSRVVGESPGLLLDGVGARYIKFHTNSTERMRITSAGNVGIGTDTPTALFGSGTTVEIQGTSGAALRLARPSYATADLYADENGLTVRTQNNFSMIFATNSTEHMRINTAGNVGIGDVSPSQKLNVAGNIMLEGSDQFMYLSNVGTGNAGIYVRGISGSTTLRSHSTGIFTWEVLGSEVMRIDSGGNLLVGTTSTSPWTNSADTAADNAIVLREDGLFVASRYGGNAAFFNRTFNDGAIVVFNKSGSTVGSIGNNTDFYIASQDGVGLRFTNNQILPCSESGAIQTTSRDLGSSSALFRDLYLAGGIQFDSRSNKLDDYEEGTWTPQMEIGGSNVTTTSTNAAYTKIGNIVHLYAGTTFASGTNTGSVKLKNLPFTASSGTRYWRGVSVNDFADNPERYYTYVYGTEAILRVGGNTQSTGSRNLNGNDIKDNFNMIFYFHITYQTTA